MGLLFIFLIIGLGLIIIGGGTTAALSNIGSGVQKIAEDPGVQEITDQVANKVKAAGQDLANEAIKEILVRMEGV